MIVTDYRLAAAYRTLFSGQGSLEDAEIVKRDLAVTCGFFSYTPAEMPAEQVKYSEGQRSVYGHLMHFLNLTDEEMRALQDAAA